MEKNPDFIILVEGGVVQEVVSTGPHLTYRLIDLDEDSDESVIVHDMETDRENVNADEYTKKTTS